MYNELAAAMRRLTAQLADNIELMGATDAQRIRDITNPPLSASHLLPAADEATGLPGPAVSVIHRGPTPGSTAAAPRFFDNAVEADAYGMRIWGATLEGLSPAERRLLYDYTKGDSTELNDFLRAGFPLLPRSRAMAEGLDDILRRRTTTEWVRVTKTIQAARLIPDHPITAVPPGYRGIFRDYVSTSLYPGGVDELKNVERRDTDVTIDIPPGVPAVYIGDLSATPEEKELLVMRELPFDLTDLQPDGDRWKAAVTVLPP
ncbi:ADP-ribosyltransferase [Nocardia testacea]|uniref:ADP-ribosyltransferase n=1 Tax=Nocardia testacea TaxID=248551 RepID=UPI0003120467|nr:ADP-ribosyltransferase [Nocardia testacea]